MTCMSLETQIWSALFLIGARERRIKFLEVARHDLRCKEWAVSWHGRDYGGPSYQQEYAYLKELEPEDQRNKARLLSGDLGPLTELPRCMRRPAVKIPIPVYPKSHIREILGLSD
jgi:hypothetical protein